MLVSQDSHARACIHQRVHGLRQPARRHAFPESCSDLPLRPRGSPSGYVAERKRQTLCASGCVQVRSSGVCMHTRKFVYFCVRTCVYTHSHALNVRTRTVARIHTHIHPPTLANTYAHTNPRTRTAVDLDSLACGAGATGVLHNLLFVIADVGDICLIPAPYFTGYRNFFCLHTPFFCTWLSAQSIVFLFLFVDSMGCLRHGTSALVQHPTWQGAKILFLGAGEYHL
jgi:hypothetical protein